MYNDLGYRHAHRVARRALQKCNPAPLVRGVFLYSLSLANDEGATSGSSGRKAIGSSIEAFASPAHTGGTLPDVGNILSGVRL